MTRYTEPNRVDRAHQVTIKAEFDRVPQALHAAAKNHTQQDPMNAHAIIAMLENASKYGKNQAGSLYGIGRNGAIRCGQMIAQDPWYQRVNAKMAARAGPKLTSTPLYRRNPNAV